MYSGMYVILLVCKLLLWLLPAGCPLTTPRLQSRLKSPKAFTSYLHPRTAAAAASHLILIHHLKIRANTAARRALLGHKLLVGLALRVCRPAATRLVVVHAHGGAETARLGALPRHEAWVVDARTVLSPGLALGAIAHLVQ